MSDTPKRGPVLMEIGQTGPQPSPSGPQHVPLDDADESTLNPADAPQIDAEGYPLPRPRTMEMVTRLVGRPPSRLTRLFFGSAAALLSFFLTIAALNFLNRLIDSYPLLGWFGTALLAVFSLAGLGLAWREYRAWSRFARIDAIQRQAGMALAENSSDKARQVADQLLSLYKDRADLKWGYDRLKEGRAETYDANSLLSMAESELMVSLDQEARREIEVAARTVAAATALIPLALADVVAALAANIRMIRRIAEIYGGRAGTVGSWKLARTVVTHLVATGAVAAGDDLIHTVAGGGMLAKLSRRFGEGVVNGALTARVGIAAMDVCRPLPFISQSRPKVGNLIARGLRGLFGSDENDKAPSGRQ